MYEKLATIYLLVCQFSVLTAAADQWPCPRVSALPSSVCGSVGVSMPVCNAASALSLCSNVTVNGVVREGESYLMELASNEAATESAQLVVLSSQVVRALSEHVFLSSTVMASTIFELTQQFGWSRITIVADLADTFLLHTAEVFYRMANLSSDSRLLQLGNSDSEIEELVNKVDRLNLRIIVLSLRPHITSKLLCRAHEKHLVWPKYAWIVHSVKVSDESCAANSTLDGVIALHLLYANKQQHQHCDFSPDDRAIHGIRLQRINSCHISSGWQFEVVLEHLGKKSVTRNVTSFAGSLGNSYPSDFPPQYVPTLYLAVFYVAISVCFIVCTIMLLLFICFRNEPAVKATSVSLSILIFIGCYLLILQSCILTTFLLPSFYKQPKELRDNICTLSTFLNGVGFPLALILSTLLVKLLRVYRLFNLKRRVSKFTTSNLALALYVLLLTLPNVLISLIWATADPYTSAVSFAISGGLLHISMRCVSSYSLLWTLLLLVYTVIVSVFLITFAVLSRKIKYQDFKDTKKVSILSFLVVFQCASFLFYWYLLDAIGADGVFIQTVLQLAYCCAVLECQMFIFAPKLFPIVKKKLIHTLLHTPAPKE